ncbi:hypothetical protein [Roseomonas populi]|uniref:Uncharacterized protein n=1 Tax=Roseomonas populi TaxID=3121582 RepID=A0ABT1WXR0_9PROT|nr:hypothetical protein [Roseomonas pecuniae]MCR0980636.1 hypothetical protein [Roseomonas pecuniae]
METSMNLVALPGMDGTAWINPQAVASVTSELAGREVVTIITPTAGPQIRVAAGPDEVIAALKAGG